ncbi:MAG TPA: FtsX-like permease family protein [Vicinamibacteria bacterium]|jgi:putative ABC transport system permease protein|nr:FtsX-like permease family protein [Vicinamibacteria bacterium]
MDLRLAVRNVFRNRRRTLLTLGVLSAGVAVLILFAGFVSDGEATLREVTIKNQYGHMQLARKAYWRDRAGGSLSDFVIEDYQELRRALERLPHVRRVAPTLEFMGLASNGDASVAFIGRGMEIDRATDPTWNFPRMVAGQVKGNTVANAAFIGKGLLRGLRAGLHDDVMLLTTTPTGALNAVDVSVEGVLETGAREFDDTMVIVPIERAQALLATPGALKLTVFLDRTQSLPEVYPLVRSYVEQRHPDLEIRQWFQLAGFYRQVVAMNRAAFDFLGLIIGGIVTFSIVNTFVMSLFERVEEVGTLRAIGATRARILRLFLLEGVAVGALGAASGVVLGVVLAKLISLKGIYIPPFPTFSMGYYSHIGIVPSAIAKACLLGVATSTLASIYPALKAARLEIVEAVRHV